MMQFSDDTDAAFLSIFLMVLTVKLFGICVSGSSRSTVLTAVVLQLFLQQNSFLIRFQPVFNQLNEMTRRAQPREKCVFSFPFRK